MNTLGLVITPWRNDNEWKEIRLLLYSNNEEERKQGSIIVKTLWNSRIGSRLPIAVISTSLLIDCIITTTTTTTNLRYTTAMIIVRCIDGLAEHSQFPGRARDIRELLSHIQDSSIDSLIDLRHACVHGILPSMDALTRGARDLLRILYNYYWSLSGDSMLSSSSSSSSGTSSTPPIWDGTASSLRSEWSSWNVSRVRSALACVSADGWRASALARVLVVWGVQALVILAETASIGVLKWMVFHSGSRRVWKSVYRRAVTENLALDAPTWQTLNNQLKIDPLVTKWLLRHRVAKHSRFRPSSRDDNDDDDDDGVIKEVPRVHIPHWDTRKNEVGAVPLVAPAPKRNDDESRRRISEDWVRTLQLEMNEEV